MLEPVLGSNFPEIFAVDKKQDKNRQEINWRSNDN